MASKVFTNCASNAYRCFLPQGAKIWSIVGATLIALGYLLAQYQLVGQIGAISLYTTGTAILLFFAIARVSSRRINECFNNAEMRKAMFFVGLALVIAGFTLKRIPGLISTPIDIPFYATGATLFAYSLILRLRKYVINNSKETTSPLASLIDAGEIEKAKELVRLGAKIDKAELQAAIDVDNHELIDLFVGLEKELLQHHNTNGETLLHVAVKSGKIEAVKSLIAKGINVNSADANGLFPLHLAAEKGHDQIVALLLSTPGISASIVSFAKQTPLHLAAERGHVECVKLLLPKFKVNAPDFRGNTPIMLAYDSFSKANPNNASQRKEVLDLLLQYKPDLNIANGEGELVLFTAITKRDLESVKLFLSHGAKIDQAKGNYYPLHAAVTFACHGIGEDNRKSIMIVGHLLSMNANPDQWDIANSVTPRQHANKQGSYFLKQLFP